MPRKSRNDAELFASRISALGVGLLIPEFIEGHSGRISRHFALTAHMAISSPKRERNSIRDRNSPPSGAFKS